MARILRLSRTGAYELLPSIGGVVPIGKPYWVVRHRFRRWLERAAS